MSTPDRTEIQEAFLNLPGVSSVDVKLRTAYAITVRMPEWNNATERDAYSLICKLGIDVDCYLTIEGDPDAPICKIDLD